MVGPVELLEPGAVYLTFDDGPHPRYTQELLELLETYGASGTFCVVGELAEAFPNAIEAVATAGSTVGNHTWDHSVRLENHDVEDAYLAQVERTSATIESILGSRPTVFRPPWGSESGTSRGRVRDLGLTTWKWHVGTQDWRTPSPPVDYMVRVLVESIVGGAQVVLLHDGVAPVQPAKAGDVDRTNTFGAVRGVLEELSG
jgi:peptidoglycan-N-acetylglucosamine deacetylase